MQRKTVINSHKSIIFLNGELPSDAFLDLINTDVPLIACDGAANRMSLEPTYTIGDFDSISAQLEKVNVIEAADQNYTDFEKCLSFVKEEKLAPVLILGVNGGEVDHIIGNAQVMAKHGADVPCYFLDSYANGIKLGLPLVEHLSFNAQVGATISIIPFETTCLTTKGLKWELCNDVLCCKGTLGLRNEAAFEQIDIDVKFGHGVIIIDLGLTLLKGKLL